MTARKTIKQKLAMMTTSEATEFLLERYSDCIVIGFDGAQASANVTINGNSTQYQVADFRHDDYGAVKKFGNQYGVDTVFVVGAYWSQEGGWRTSVSKYSRK
ncbi:MAG: hypothetical protein EBR82_46815 [Caulobacteraceae bacterium]|nr:hypothetical protein [Caulobacteraceae bacterium]